MLRDPISKTPNTVLVELLKQKEWLTSKQEALNSKPSAQSLCHITPDSLNAEGTAEPLSLVCLGSVPILRMGVQYVRVGPGV
jgi:hypothetical protein